MDRRYRGVAKATKKAYLSQQKEQQISIMCRFLIQN